MSLIEKLTNELKIETDRVWDEYVKLHEELDPHRGKPINDTDLNEVNRILKDIQMKFSELYHAYYFIAIKHQHVSNAVTEFNEFIESIKKYGASQDDSGPSKIITG